MVPWVYLRRQDGDPDDINPDIFPDESGSRFYLSCRARRSGYLPT